MELTPWTGVGHSTFNDARICLLIILAIKTKPEQGLPCFFFCVLGVRSAASRVAQKKEVSANLFEETATATATVTAIASRLDFLGKY